MHFLNSIYFLVNNFRDASCLLYTKYSVTIEECVNALYKAKWYGFFYSDDFDLDEYEKYEVSHNKS